MKDWSTNIDNYVLPMAAKVADEKLEQYFTADWVVDEKLDGTRCGLYIGHWSDMKSRHGKARGFSRRISVTDGLPVEISEKIPHLTVVFEHLNGTLFDTEIIHEEGFAAGREILGSDKERAIAMQFGKPLRLKRHRHSFNKLEHKLVQQLIDNRANKGLTAPHTVTFFEDKYGKKQVAPWYGPVTAVVFDLPVYCGQMLTHNTPLRKRLAILHGAFKGFPSLQNNPYLRPAYPLRADRWAKLIHRKIIEQGGEGTMLKRLDGLYIPSAWDYSKNKLWESRSGDWRKHKKEYTFDVVIMGYEEPKPLSVKVGQSKATETKFHNLGWIGAIKFGVYKDGELYEIGTCSGMPDEVRKAISENRLHYLGRVVEVEAHAMFPGTYALAHPRWLRFRDDKYPKACTLEAHIEAGKKCLRK